jgi:epoxide hydrolase-like predicted phosphatase
VTLAAVVFDLGGVVLESPFVAFHNVEARYGLARGTIATAIKTAGEQGALARIERGEIDAEQFYAQLEREIGDHGTSLTARDVTQEMARVITVRSVMLDALRRLRTDGYKLAALTNNYDIGDELYATMDSVRREFDVFVESCREGVRKPEARIYQITCERLGVSASDCVFLDDLGDNVKAARALGMQTIKVNSPEQALRELAQILI